MNCKLMDNMHDMFEELQYCTRRRKICKKKQRLCRNQKDRKKVLKKNKLE